MDEEDQKPQVEKPINTGAAPTIVAFTFQFDRALNELFSSGTPDRQVGIETLDDVAELVAQADGTVVAKLEQDANTVQASGHPYQDSSRKLWHTLRVWLSHLSDLKQYAETEFRLVTNVSVPSGTLVRRLSDAVSEKDIEAAVAALREQANAVLANEKSTASKEASFVAKYADDDLAYLIGRLKLSDKGGTASGQQPREDTIQRFLLPSGLVAQGDEIYQHILGVAVDKCRMAWEKGEAAWFSPQMFKDLLHKEVGRRSLKDYLERPMMSVGFKEYVQAGGRDHFFLKQLTHLGLPTRYVDEQLDNYWAFYIERVRLEGEGVHQADWLAREDQLHQRWRTCRNNAELDLEDAPPAAIGKRTLRLTLDGEYKAPIGRYKSENLYFTHGHYHHLANAPDESHFVYWHPDFANKDDAKDGGGE
ncbi:ABC-three component system protein [Burkholderia ambifaria]|uniref:ABC-three component system protein n=1 Tax=Burkholderia ambifaria TaxID=152480 RepID=UPI001589EDA1|nr:ABC-three component system protein [Burkholderia ambifaria]